MSKAGKTLRQKRLGPFRLAERSYLPGTRLPVHEHGKAYISLVVSGGYAEVSHEGERACSAGTVIWHPRGEAHADHFHATGGLVFDFEIDAAWLGDAAQEFALPHSSRISCGGAPYTLALRLYRALSVDGCAASDSALELLSLFLSGADERQPPPWFRRALEFAATLTWDDKPSLTSLAREVDVHPVHVARSFRRFTGCTFGDYIGQVRLKAAFDLLLVPGRSIADVAHASGFADHAHLCRTFKAATGLTPTQFRGNTRPVFPAAKYSRG